MFKGVIPTDSLYKFMAVFGLALTITAVISVAVIAPDLEVIAELVAGQRALAANPLADAVIQQTGFESYYSELLTVRATVLVGKAVVIGGTLLVGLGTSAFGFFMWYYRKQLLEDQVLVYSTMQSTAEALITNRELGLKSLQLGKEIESLDEAARQAFGDFVDGLLIAYKKVEAAQP